MNEKTVYVITDHFESQYAFFPLESTVTQIAVIGPYLIDEPNEEFLSKILQKNTLTSSMRYPLQTYFHSLPLCDSQTIISTINEMASLLYGGTDCYLVDFFNEDWENIDVQSNLILPNEEIVLNMQVLEERYQLENQLLNAIQNGNRRSAIASFQEVASLTLKRRSHNPVRATKNYALVLNGLYRKAAEKSSVHPVYLDDISRRFSSLIEQTQSIVKLNNLMLEMTRKYCILVKNHSLRNYSPIIRECINYINLNLSSQLSLQVLANALSINASYLSSMFKKEMGITMTEFINSQRINLAIQLLNSSSLSIQSIAWHVGLNDVNYFSRIFKRIVGLTPSDYRNSLRK